MITVECCTKCAYQIMGTSVPVSEAVSSFLDVNRGCRYSVPSVPPGGDTCDICGRNSETIEIKVVRSIEYWLRGLGDTVVAAKALAYARRSNVEGVECDNLAYALISIHNWNDTDEGFGLWANLYNALCTNSADIGTCYRDLVLKMCSLFEDKVRGKKIYWSHGSGVSSSSEVGREREERLKFVEWLDERACTFLADDGWPASAYGYGLPEYDDRLEDYNGKGNGFKWVIESRSEDEDIDPRDAGSEDGGGGIVSIEKILLGIPDTIVAAKALAYAKRGGVEGEACDNVVEALVRMAYWGDTDEGGDLWSKLCAALRDGAWDVKTCYDDLVLKMCSLFEDKVRGKTLRWVGPGPVLEGIMFREWYQGGKGMFVGEDGYVYTACGHGLPEYDDRLEDCIDKGLGYRWVIGTGSIGSDNGEEGL